LHTLGYTVRSFQRVVPTGSNICINNTATAITCLSATFLEISVDGLNLLITDLKCVKNCEDAVLLNVNQLTGIWPVKRCIVIMHGNLQLTLAIIKPHVTKAPHALQVGI
jgi:hypothetical protein